jgi:hypothetical protein
VLADDAQRPAAVQESRQQSLLVYLLALAASDGGWMIAVI